MVTPTEKTPTFCWSYQNDAGDAVHIGKPTDARGLRLRADSGYTHVHMGTADGWLQISVAIRKVSLAEKLAAIPAHCEGCDSIQIVAPYRVTNHEGAMSHAMYCIDCADLAKCDWNGETAKIEALS